MMFSRTLSWANGCVTWKVRTMPRRQTTCGARPVMSAPRKRTLPSSGAANPVMAANKVVLPAPLGPISAAIEPSATSRLARSTARRPPKILLRPRTSSTAPPHAHQIRQAVRQEADDHHQQAAVDDERKPLRFGQVAGDLAHQRQQERADQRPVDRAGAA